MEVVGVPSELETSAIVAIATSSTRSAWRVCVRNWTHAASRLGSPKVCWRRWRRRRREILRRGRSGGPSDLLESSELGSRRGGRTERGAGVQRGGAGSRSSARSIPYLARGLSYYTGPIYEIEFPGSSRLRRVRRALRRPHRHVQRPDDPGVRFQPGVRRHPPDHGGARHVPGVGSARSRRCLSRCLTPAPSLPRWRWRIVCVRVARRFLPRQRPLRQAVQVRRGAQHSLRRLAQPASWQPASSR